MKTRLTIILTSLALLAVAAASTARGDEQYVHTCNSTGNHAGVTGLGIGFFGNVDGHAQMIENFDYQCGHGGTVEWELQARIGAVWTDDADSAGNAIDHQVRNTGAAGHWVFFSNDSSNLQPCGPGHSDYRLVVRDSTPGAGIHIIEHDFAGSCP